MNVIGFSALRTDSEWHRRRLCILWSPTPSSVTFWNMYCMWWGLNTLRLRLHVQAQLCLVSDSECIPKSFLRAVRKPDSWKEPWEMNIRSTSQYVTDACCITWHCFVRQLCSSWSEDMLSTVKHNSYLCCSLKPIRNAEFKSSSGWKS